MSKPETTATPLIPGYEIKELIYDQGFTRVYRALRCHDNRPVILKAVRDEEPAGDALAALQHEFELGQRLRAGGVIEILALELGARHPVMVVEDFGGTALNLLMEQQRFPLAEVLNIGIMMARGIGEIHAADIIHKDINPSNVVYNPATGVLKIIDFGISTYLTREQAGIANANVVQASLPYISPEQTGRMNRSIDYRTDFYSLGVTLYQLLTGELPFMAEEAMEWFHCHIATPAPAVHSVDPAIPRPVSDIVSKLLAKMAEERYQSSIGIVRDLQICLQQLQSSGTVTAFPLGVADVSRRFQIPQRLYGREQEARKLLSCFDRVASGGRELVLVSGYSGIGKTCLIREVCKPITEQYGYFVAGKFDQLNRDVPYSAIAAALRDLIKQLISESESRLALWRERLQQALGVNGRIMVDLVPELGWIIGPQPELSQLPPLEAEQRFQRAFMSFVGVFSQAGRPLVIFLDDLQWADTSSLVLMELTMSPDVRLPGLMLIGAYRDNEVGPESGLVQSINHWEAENTPLTQLNLRPLELSDLANLLRETLHRDQEAVAPLARLVQEKTAGNPFFTEEFLLSLYRQELFRFDAESGCWHWELARIQAQQITDNVVDLITAKLHRLEPATRQLLQQAACVGNRFPLAVLMVIADLDLDQLLTQLQQAMSHGLIAPKGSAYQLLELKNSDTERPTLEFAFAHDRIQQAAYALLQDSELKQVHLKIGRLMLRRLDSTQQQ